MSLKRFLCVSLFIINLPWLNTITVCSKLNINQIVSVQPLTSSLPSIPPDSNSSIPAFSISPSLWSLSAWPSVKLQNIDILIMDPRQRRWGLRGFEVPRVDLPTLRYPLTWLPSAQVHPRDIVLSWQCRCWGWVEVNVTVCSACCCCLFLSEIFSSGPSHLTGDYISRQLRTRCSRKMFDIIIMFFFTTRDTWRNTRDEYVECNNVFIVKIFHTELVRRQVDRRECSQRWRREVSSPQKGDCLPPLY